MAVKTPENDVARNIFLIIFEERVYLLFFLLTLWTSRYDYMMNSTTANPLKDSEKRVYAVFDLINELS